MRQYSHPIDKTVYSLKLCLNDSFVSCSTLDFFSDPFPPVSVLVFPFTRPYPVGLSVRLPAHLGARQVPTL